MHLLDIIPIRQSTCIIHKQRLRITVIPKVDVIVVAQGDITPRQRHLSTSLNAVPEIGEGCSLRDFPVVLVAKPEENLVLRKSEQMQQAEHVVQAVALLTGESDVVRDRLPKKFLDLIAILDVREIPNGSKKG